MRNLRRGLVVAAAIVGCAVAAPSAQADTPPGRWERAKDPEAGDAYRLHVDAQARLASIKIVRDHRGSNGNEAREILTKLLRNGADKSKDVRLRIDLADCYDELKDYTSAARVLKEAIELAPDHSAIDNAWWMLAIACGHLGDHGCERKAYEEFLRRTTEDHRRLTASLNLAETEMHLGNLRTAIEGYRETMRLAARHPLARETAPLAEWGLAVALDRSGDRIGAEKEARFAYELEKSLGFGVRGRTLLRSETVFFYPQYEIHWYEGLGAAARARVAATPSEAVDLWREAELSFGTYVRRAEVTKERDRWLELAKTRAAQATAEREAAEKRKSKETPPPKEPGLDAPITF